jgi:outer membrane protein TolC
MKRLFFTILIFGLFAEHLYSQELTQTTLSLNNILEKARAKSVAVKIAESIKENKHFIYNSYKAGLKPQLQIDGNLADYSRDFFGVRQPDGTLIFQSRKQNYSNLGLSLSQQIGITGGLLSVNSNLTRFDDFDLNFKQYNSLPLNLMLSQPLFSFNSYKWDKKIEPLKLQEAEKEYNKEIEEISLQSTKLYFNVIEAQVDFELAKKNLASQQSLLTIEMKRIDLGTTSKDKILQLNLQLLRSKQDLSRADVNFKTSLFNLKSYIGIRNDLPIFLQLPEDLPIINIDANTALEEAKKNRAEFISYNRKKLEAQRDLDQAKKNRFKANLNLSYGYNNIGNTLATSYRDPNSQQSFSFGVGIPILDWGRTTGKISIATSNLNTVLYTIEQEEQILMQEINNLVQNIKLISDNIAISKEADLIAQERFDLAYDKFRYGKLSLTELGIALSEKDLAKRSYITALRSFWEGYFELKALTLMKI